MNLLLNKDVVKTALNELPISVLEIMDSRYSERSNSDFIGEMDSELEVSVNMFWDIVGEVITEYYLERENKNRNDEE